MTEARGRWGERKGKAKATKARPGDTGEEADPSLDELEKDLRGHEKPNRRAFEAAIKSQSPQIRRIVELPFSVLARVRGDPKWRLTAEESLELGEAVTACMVAYMPDVTRYYPGIQLATALGGILIPRLEILNPPKAETGPRPWEPPVSSYTAGQVKLSGEG